LAIRPVRLRLLLTPPDRDDLPESALEIERIPESFGRRAGYGVVVIDVLRATSSLAHAFAEGAAEALFFSTLRAAIESRRQAASSVLACGEREGIKVAGFDLGNSPLEFTRRRVAGASLYFASTNGSRAFLATHEAARQWAVAFVNLEAGVRRVAEWLTRRGAESPEAGDAAADLHVVCAGKLDEPAAEDTACAARLVLRLMATLGAAGVDVETQVEGGALAFAPESEEETLRIVAESEHGRYLASLGPEFEADVAWCSRWDALDVVPEGVGGRLRGSDGEASRREAS
jgi:2-phosphosulfolactate phosphatase